MEELVWRDPEEVWQAPEWLLTPAQRRRLKALMVLVTVWTGVYLLHQFPVLRWGVVALSLLILGYITWLFQAESEATPTLTLSATGIPKVSLLIPAKNEAAVLPNVIASVAALDYPQSHLDVWVIDDASTDATPEVLADLQRTYPWLQVHRRLPGSGGGKSGALNEVLPLTVGAVVAVFDADARLPSDLLQRALPLLQGGEKVGAVQVRKAIANATENAWTQGQAAEMILDAYLQQQRVAVGGFGELRGNGQLVHRSLLVGCGGWNESTVTDDLDLSFKLHLAGAEIAFLPDPPVYEEGVTGGIRLWHQRSRWAEGGVSALFGLLARHGWTAAFACETLGFGGFFPESVPVADGVSAGFSLGCLDGSQSHALAAGGGGLFNDRVGFVEWAPSGCGSARLGDGEGDAPHPGLYAALGAGDDCHYSADVCAAQTPPLGQNRTQGLRNSADFPPVLVPGVG